MTQSLLSLKLLFVNSSTILHIQLVSKDSAYPDKNSSYSIPSNVVVILRNSALCPLHPSCINISSTQIISFISPVAG